MKSFIRRALPAYALTMALLLTACSTTAGGTTGSEPQQAQTGKSLYQQGSEVAMRMEEMVESEEYLKLYTTNPQILQLISACAGDYSQPKAVYDLSVPADSLLGIIDEELNALSPTLKEEVIGRAQSALPTMINSRQGAEVLAASSICVAGKTFVSNESVEEGKLYLYLYEDGCPVIVHFAPGEDNSVRAQGMLLFGEELRHMDPEGLETLLAELSVQLVPVE